MEKWRITGADVHTGTDRSIEVNARDEAGAREAARMLGMVVAHVEPLAPPQGPVLNYLTPGVRNLSASIPTAEPAPPPPPPPPPPGPPHYPAILTGVAAVTAAARLAYAIGMCALTAAAASIVAALAVTLSPDTAPLLPLVLLILLISALGGAALLATATALQLLAATSLAIRDTARNTSPTPSTPERRPGFF